MMFPVDLGKHLDITFGPQLYAALLSEENEDVMAVSVGAELRWFFDSSHRFAISGQAFYSPDILTFGSADNVIDLSARAEIRSQTGSSCSAECAGLNSISIDDTGERTLQEEVFFGRALSHVNSDDFPRRAVRGSIRPSQPFDHPVVTP